MIQYRGESFKGYNIPRKLGSSDKTHKYIVLAKEGEKIKMLRFGAKGYKHNYSPEAKKNFRSRHSCDVAEKGSKLTKRFWSCWFLWPKNKTADGSARS